MVALGTGRMLAAGGVGGMVFPVTGVVAAVSRNVMRRELLIT